MATIKTKGTALQIASGTTYVSVAQITSISSDGVETETFESRTLDGGVGVTHDPTGYAEGGSVTFGLFWDPALSGHQTLTDLVTAGHLSTTGAPNDQGWKVVFADTSSTEMTFTSAGIGFGFSAEMTNGLTSDVTLKLDGIPTYAT
jgi:hypothetical protein